MSESLPLEPHALRKILLVAVPPLCARDAILEVAAQRGIKVEISDFAPAPEVLKSRDLDLVLFGLDAKHETIAAISSVLEGLHEEVITALVASDDDSELLARGIECGVDHYLFSSANRQRVTIFLDLMLVRRKRRRRLVLRQRASEYLLKAIPDLVMVLDREGVYHEAVSAQSSEHLFIRPPSELIGRKVADFFAPEEAALIVKTIGEVLDSGENRVLPYKLTFEGKEHWFAGHGAKLHPEDHQRVIWVARDITEKREAEQVASETASLLQAVLDSLPLGIFWKDRESRFLGMNRFTCEAIGAASPEDVVGKTDHDFENTRTHADHYREFDKKVMESGEPQLGIIEQIEQPETDPIWLRTNKVPLCNDAGEVIGVLGSFENISDERKLEIEHERLRAHLASAQSLARIGSWEYDSTTGKTDWSDELYRIHDLEIGDERFGQENIDLLFRIPEEAEMVRAAYAECYEHGTPFEFIAQLTTAKGNQRMVRQIGRRISPTLLRGSVQDVTESYQQREELEASRAFLRNLMDAMPIGIYWKDRDSRFLGANDFFLRTAGLSHEDQVIGKTDHECGVPLETAEEYLREDREVMETGVPVLAKTYGLQIPGFPPLWLRGNKVPLIDPRGKTIGVLGSYEDVTLERHQELDRIRTHALLETTQEIAKVGGWEWDIGREALFWTDEIFALFELPIREMPDLNDAFAFWDSENRQTLTELFQASLNEGTPYDYEAQIRTAQGTVKWARATARAVRDKSGKIVKLVGTIQDTTQQRAAQAKAEWSAKLLEQTSTLSGVGGWRYRIEADKLDVTDNLRQVLDLASESFDSLASAIELAELEDRPIIERAIQRCIEDGKPFSVEIRVAPQGGESVWARVHGEPRFRDGKVSEVYGAFLNITKERQRIEEQKSFEARVQHAQKLESLGVLAGGIAHDFNNLLVSMMGYASMALGMTAASAPAHEKIANVVEAAKKAADLTKQMLAYSGKGKFVIEEVSINDLVKEMGNILRITLPKGVVLKENYAQNLPKVSADKAQVSQIVMNLITNAGEAIGDRSGIVTVSTSVVDADSDYLAGAEWDNQLAPGYYVCLEVSDTGTGMDDVTRARIFDPFFTTKFTGRGLGLAAVLGIVRGHKGAIRVYSEGGRGTTFKVLLPVSKNDRPDVTPSSTRAVDALSGHALVVDDEESVRAVAKMILEDVGMSVVTANDGRDGVEKFRANPDLYAVVILDMTMPHLNGPQAFKEMRKIRPDACVVLSSGYTEQDATSSFAGKGLSGFIQKPYLPLDLVQAVRKAIGIVWDEPDA